MLNPRKIKWMTKASIYAQKEERGAFRMNQYFAGDYICYGMIKAAIGITIVALLVLGVWGVMHAEELLTTTAYEDLIALAYKIAFYYATALVVFVGIAFVVFAAKYALMQKSLREYVVYLKKIKKIQTEEKKAVNADQEEQETW
ncbi:MAG: hypothetical protein IKU83_05075 [Lachnospiraceae bacterium]|nr:hypothetical protein [Lachnospiraceae bacterium]